MTRFQAWTIHVSNLAVGLTGLVYGWMRYFVESEDPFAIANHPWQGDMQHAHILTAPLLVFAVGTIWQAHVWRRIRNGHRGGRWTGLTLALSLVPMIVSGYAIQTSVEEVWRDVWIWVHVATSLLWLLLAVVHPILGWARSNKTPTIEESARLSA